MPSHLDVSISVDDILSTAGRTAADLHYLLVYGSSVKAGGAARDIDVLLVCRKGECSYSTIAIKGQAMHLHIATESAIDDDLRSDRYGWIFLTKFLDDFHVLAGDRTAADRVRGQAYLRLFGQWASSRGISAVSDLNTSFEGILSVLTTWNPQFATYVARGLIDPARYRRYFTSNWLRSVETLIVPDDVGGFRLDIDSPFLRETDLRVVLVRYWTHYVSYKMNPDSYLSPRLNDLLAAKGMR